MKGTVFQGDCYTTINNWYKAHTIPDLGQPIIKMRKLRPGKEKDTQGHRPYWQQYSGESFSLQSSKPPTGWDIPSRWLLGWQWGFRSWKHLEKVVIGHNLGSHFFTISLWFSEVGQKNENLSNGMRDDFRGPRHGEGRHKYAGFCGYELPIQGSNYELPQGLT